VGKVAVISPKGDLSFGSTTKFLTVLENFQEKGFLRIVINFAYVESLTSQGVGTILGFSKQFNPKDGEISFCAIPKHINEVLLILNLKTAFKCFESEKEAIESLQE